MSGIIFDLQRFAEVLVGKNTSDKIAVKEDKTQIYGLAGSDTLESNDKSNVLLIGGSGNDVFNMTGGNGTLSGGNGSDIFNLSYSADKKISAVIEDIEPTKDKITITYNGSDVSQLNSIVSGGDVILMDEKGYFNLTLKGSNDASDYYEGNANDYIWDILRIVNQERESRNLSPLTLSQGLTDGSSIRAKEIEELFSHTRPNGTSCFTAVTKSYSSMGENIAAGNDTPQKTMIQWMNSPGHKANILNDGFKKLGVGYYYNSTSYYKSYWVQMFGKDLSSPDTISTDKILTTKMTLKGAKILIDTAKDAEPITNSEPNAIITGSADNDSITSKADNVKIDGKGGNDSITVDQTSDYDWNSSNWIYTTHNKATISGGAGADVITNYNNQALIDGGAGFDKIFNHGDNSTVKAASGNNLVVNGEYFSKGGTNIKINTGTGNDTITNSGSNSMLDGGAGDDLIYNGYYFYEPWNTFYDYSYNNKYNDNAGSSNTTIICGAGNDYVKNRGENVLFKYTSGDGNDFIEGFTATSTLSIAGGYSSQKSDSDVIVTVGNNKITLQGAASLSKVNITVTKSTSTTTTLTVTDKTKSPVTAGSAIKTINASKRTKAVKITGNSLANTIKGGSGKDSIYGGNGKDSILGNAGADKLYGQAGNDILKGGKGNDTLTGGKGNDSLWGNAGKDTFIYASGDGKDIIYGFDNTDMLKITGKFSGTYNKSKKEIYFKVGSTASALTLKDFSATSFNVNSINYKISGSKLVKK